MFCKWRSVWSPLACKREQEYGFRFKIEMTLRRLKRDQFKIEIQNNWATHLVKTWVEQSLLSPNCLVLCCQAMVNEANEGKIREARQRVFEDLSVSVWTPL